MVGDCHYYCGTLGGWVLCFARRRRINTYTARDCRNLSTRLAVYRQKAVEINYTLFLKFHSKLENNRLVKQTVT
jgi:hypothetical protein